MSFRIAVALLFVVLPLSAQSLAQANAAISAGQPWRATQLVAPLLAKPATRTPEAVMLAARAAGEWGGWSTVESLLRNQPWLDTRFDRLGRRLLAEAALAQQRNDEAVIHARASVRPATVPRLPAEQGHRITVLARAFDRTDQLDSAAAMYRRAAALLPAVADWLLLRAAGVTRDSASRAALYQRVKLASARRRILPTEALALERIGQSQAAVAAYETAHLNGSALRLRWELTVSDTAARQILTHDLARAVARANADERIELFDLIARLNPPFERSDRIVVGGVAVLTRPSIAASQFEAAAAESPLDAAQRRLYADALGRLNRWSDVAALYRGVSSGEATYATARALVRSGRPGATTLLQRVIGDPAVDSGSAAIATFLLADLTLDAGRPDSARSLLRRLVAEHPRSTLRARAEQLAALIAFAARDFRRAATELSVALTDSAARTEWDADRYWLGRAQLALRDTASARTTFTMLLSRGPESYYAQRAAQRLDTLPWRIGPIAKPAVSDSLRQAFARAALLDTLGMDAEETLEINHASMPQLGPQFVETAYAMTGNGYYRRGLQVALNATFGPLTSTDPRWWSRYPLPFEATLRSAASENAIDPLLAASVIRQESNFEPRATSVPGARGLMQVMPSTGAELARNAQFASWDPALLYVGDVNIALGMRHFAAALKKYPEPERALAAYNAGGSPVDRWSATPFANPPAPGRARDPVDDIELFVERIPYPETRDYVRIVMRNWGVYGMMYVRR